MGVKFANNAYSTLASKITDSDTTITVKTGEGNRFPTANSSTGDYFYVTLVDQSGNREIVKVIDRDPGSDTMTIERAQQGTTARSFAADDIVSHRLEAETLTSIVNGSGIDGDKLDIDWNPSNYTPDASISEVDDEDDLSAHLKGIDDKFSDVDNELNNCAKINESNEFTQDQYVNGNLIWHAGNDGSDSGLDADLLDGQHGSFYRNASNLNAGTVPAARLSGTYNINITGTAENANKLDSLDSSDFVKFNDLTVIKLSDNADSIVWEKIGELRGKNASKGAELSFTIYGSGGFSGRGRQTLFVNAQQRSDNSIQIDVYSLENGNVADRRITVGYVQVGTYDFDIYIKRDYYNPCIIVGSSSTFNGTIIKNPTTLSSEPSEIVYVNTNKIWHEGNDGSGSGLDADLVRGLPADFTCSKNTSGYTKLPNGLIIQWGVVINPSDGVDTITFPIEFPNDVFCVVAGQYEKNTGSGLNSTAVGVPFTIDNITVSFFLVDRDNDINGTPKVHWIAIGY